MKKYWMLTYDGRVLHTDPHSFIFATGRTIDTNEPDWWFGLWKKVADTFEELNVMEDPERKGYYILTE
jgi:hypothetical protein